MKYLMNLARRRVTRLLAAGTLLIGGISASVLAGAGAADATTCGSAVAAASSCTLTGTLSLSGGSLTLTSPGQLRWSTTLNGLNQNVADTNSSDQSFIVDDATGSGDGWNIGIEATQFSTSGGTVHTLATSGVLSANGNTSTYNSGTGPDAACYAGSTCSTTSNLVSAYPVAIPTPASPSSFTTIWDEAGSGDGMGQYTVGSSDPMGWWLALPADTYAGTYTSTVTLEINSGP